MKSANISYMPGVDHLRALAALMILVYHGLHLIGYRVLYNAPFQFDRWEVAGNPLSALLLEGHMVVGLFMVLSGFVLSLGAQGRTIRYSGFLRNRLLSLYPLYLFLLMAGLYAYPQNFTFSGFVQSLLMLNNLPGALALGAFSTIFWFVTVWVQCYLLFPFLHDSLERRGLSYALGLIVLMLALRIIIYKLGGNVRDLSYGTVVGRLDQFVIGMATARLMGRVSWGRRGWLIALLLSSAAVLAMAYGFNHHGGWPAMRSWKAHWPTLEGLVWAGFLVCYVRVTESLSRGWINAALSWLGSLSYSIIMLHLVVIELVLQKHWLFDFGLPAYQNAAANSLVVILPLTLLLSMLTHNIIEKPFLAYRVKYYEH